MSEISIPARRPARRLNIFDRLARARALGRQRYALDQLDAHLLRDVGLSRDEARQEARRGPWDAPDWWR